jgi:hypothetical protein
MNWKNVAFLVSVERKSGRLIRGQRLTQYRESRLTANLFYIIALGLGTVIGFLVGNSYSASFSDPTVSGQFHSLALSFFLSLPTLVLIYSVVFTMFGQIQRSGIKASSQVPYWLPITWQEHTLASILANMLGFPLISIVGIASGIIFFGFFAGLVVPAVLTSLAMCAAAFMASAITEIFRVLQVRFIGAVYKSTGRAAIWVRFAGSLIFFLLFYIAYFSVVYGSGALTFIQTVASTQNSAWFVPFVWLGITLNYLTSGLLLQGLAFLGLSLLFIAGLFFLGTWLNGRFGLYEPPAITITHGVYAPKTGFLGRLGFSTSEAALIRKDLKAFTRRRELMTIFIGPIVIVLVPLLQQLGQSGAAFSSQASLLWAGLTFLFPCSIMAMSLGNLIVGEEGQAVWRIYAAPFSPNNFVKSKYFFVVLFGLMIFAITSTLGIVLYRLPFRVAFVGASEAVFLVFALSAVSLANGIKGADFNELPRPRMIRVEWSLVNLVACFLAGAAILGPLLPYALSGIIPGFGVLDPYIAVVVSAVIAAVITLVFYRIAVKNAEELIKNAES